jgi:hypothetical protein
VEADETEADHSAQSILGRQFRSTVPLQELHEFYRVYGGGWTCQSLAYAPKRAAHRAELIKARSEERADARAYRECETCGKPIEANRSTMRFCSVRCRVAAHRKAEHADH